MELIRIGKMRAFDFTPVDDDGNDQTLERPAIVTTSDPLFEIIELDASGLKGFVGNRGSLATATFNIKGDGIKDGVEAFNIDFSAELKGVGANAIGLRGSFGEEVDIR